MRLLTKNNRQLVGVDITTTSVKIVEITRQQGLFHLKNYGIAPLPMGLVADKRIVDVEAVSDVLAGLARSLNLSTKNVATAVAGTSVISKVIEMDSDLNDIEREARIRLDAEQYIPYPLEEVNIDFEVLGPSPNSPELVEVLLVASRSENVDQCVEVMSLAGLTTKVVDVESFAIERALGLIVDGLSMAGEAQHVALIDIGHTQTTLYVARDGQFIYSREQLFGGAQLTESIQSRYGLTPEEALQSKRSMNLPADYQQEVLHPFMELVVQQITRALQFYFSTSQSHHIDHILLAGGTAGLSGLDRLVERKLGNPTSVANPFLNLTTAAHIDPTALTADAPSLLAACGLALRSFD